KAPLFSAITKGFNRKIQLQVSSFSVYWRHHIDISNGGFKTDRIFTAHHNFQKTHYCAV
ncbi:unnamed protein product, partial [Brassica rapa subsp. trilocularis]